jgi:2-amino-4-hydroxy-6-hydroxymethyldihydropteridine diphosphokinase
MMYHRSPVPHAAYIALGSNLGNREQTLRLALERLNGTEHVRVIKVSSLLENAAVGGPADSPAFLNAAAQIETELDASALLKALLKVEQSLGRHRLEKWGPRTIDLDLLLYEKQIIQVEGLIVPHPLMHMRRFVLEPLAEIAPDAVHPIMNKTISQLMIELWPKEFEPQRR